MNPNFIPKNSDALYWATEDTRRKHGQRGHYKFSVALQPNFGLCYLINEVSWSDTHTHTHRHTNTGLLWTIYQHVAEADTSNTHHTPMPSAGF